MAKGHAAPGKRRVPTGSERLIRHVRNLISSASEQDEALKKALQLLQSVLGSDAVVALLFNDQDHSFRITEQRGLTSPYYGDVLAGLEDVVREIKRIELSVRAPKRESDYHVLKALFGQFVGDKPDAIAVCTQSPTAVRDLQILHRVNIPVFFFNVPEKIGDPDIRSYVGYDQEEAGKTVGRYLARLLRGRGRLAILEGLPEPTNRLRVAGFRKALKAFPEMAVVASERADWMPSLARKATAGILRRHGDLDAIFAVSDAMALGAVEAAKAKGKLGRIFIVGLDGTRDALQSIKDGELTATLNTNPREMGRILLRTIVRGLIKEEKIARQIYSPINIVSLENVDQALNP